MAKIIYLPLEKIEERYTPMFNNELGKISDLILYPDFNYSDKIENGQFLDINKTMIFKNMQLQMVSELFYKGLIENGDVFLVADIFYPGLEQIKYMSELQGINVKIASFNHAGRSDKNDFVQKLGLWSNKSEKAWHMISDLVLFGSDYHRLQTCNFFDIDIKKTKTTGMIWSSDFVDSIFKPTSIEGKKDQIVWPHRVSEEKGINELLEIAKINKGKKFIITSSNDRGIGFELPENIEYRNSLSKKEYYQILNESKYYLSTAHQETFGYTLHEAIHFHCLIACPNRASYVEILGEDRCYNPNDLYFIKFYDCSDIKGMFNDNFKYVESLIKKLQ